MSIKATIDPRIAKKALSNDLKNIAQRARDGVPLTESQRKRLAKHVGWVSKADMLDAVAIITAHACNDCRAMLEQLSENLKNA